MSLERSRGDLSNETGPESVGGSVREREPAEPGGSRDFFRPPGPRLPVAVDRAPRDLSSDTSPVILDRRVPEIRAFFDNLPWRPPSCSRTSLNTYLRIPEG